MLFSIGARKIVREGYGVVRNGKVDLSDGNTKNYYAPPRGFPLVISKKKAEAISQAFFVDEKNGKVVKVRCTYEIIED